MTDSAAPVHTINGRKYALESLSPEDQRIILKLRGLTTSGEARKMRMTAGYSQAEVSRETGIGVSQVRELELGNLLKYPNVPQARAYYSWLMKIQGTPVRCYCPACERIQQLSDPEALDPAYCQVKLSELYDLVNGPQPDWNGES